MDRFWVRINSEPVRQVAVRAGSNVSALLSMIGTRELEFELAGPSYAAVAEDVPLSVLRENCSADGTTQAAAISVRTTASVGLAHSFCMSLSMYNGHSERFNWICCQPKTTLLPLACTRRWSSFVSACLHQ